MFICKSGEHRAITGVYYIPRMNTHIISLGQFDENGCQVLIEDGQSDVQVECTIRPACVFSNTHSYRLILDLACPVRAPQLR
jgi:hypothetical protein